MFEEAQQSWLRVFEHGDDATRINHRLLLKTHGSEFARREYPEARRVNVASNLARTLLLGPKPTNAELAAGSKRLVVPSTEIAVFEELNFLYRENAGGSITDAINACTLEVLVNGETPKGLDKFTLNNWKRGESGIAMGALALGIILPPQATLRIYFKGEGAGGDAMDLHVSPTIRFEPLWLMKAAGLVLQRSP